MKKLSSNSILSVAAFVLAGALIFFALRYTQRVGSGWVQLPPPPDLSQVVLETPPTLPDGSTAWVVKSLGDSSCYAYGDTLNAFLEQVPGGWQTSFGSEKRLVIRDNVSEVRTLHPELGRFCPLKFYGSKLYGAETVYEGPATLFQAEFKLDGSIATSSLGILNQGLVSPNDHFYMYSTNTYGSVDALLFCGSVLGNTTSSIRILNLVTGASTTAYTGTDAFVPVGWSPDGSSIGYKEYTHEPVSSDQCTEKLTFVRSGSIDTPAGYR